MIEQTLHSNEHLQRITDPALSKVVWNNLAHDFGVPYSAHNVLLLGRRVHTGSWCRWAGRSVTAEYT